MGKIAKISSTFLISIIRVYQYFFSPFVGKHCRFYPSCSTYAIEAIQLHGSLLGSFLIFKRILRCQPWHPGGIDPVPKRNHSC